MPQCMGMSSTGWPPPAPPWGSPWTTRRGPEGALVAIILAVVLGVILVPMFFVFAFGGSGFPAAIFAPFCGVMLRQDLRHDLLLFEGLRPLPFVGWRLVAAEVTVPLVQARDAAAHPEHLPDRVEERGPGDLGALQDRPNLGLLEDPLYRRDPAELLARRQGR